MTTTAATAISGGIDHRGRASYARRRAQAAGSAARTSRTSPSSMASTRHGRPPRAGRPRCARARARRGRRRCAVRIEALAGRRRSRRAAPRGRSSSAPARLDDLRHGEAGDQGRSCPRSPGPPRCETWYCSPAGSKSRSEPTTKHTAPASASAPWLTTNASATKNASARIMSRTPAQLTGSTWRPKRPTMSEMAPTVPGKIRPGLKISTVIPSTPSDISEDDDVRVDERVEDPLPERHLDASTSAPAVFRTRPFGSSRMPSISSSSVGRSGATTSTTFSSSASCAPRLEASPHRLLRPVAVASVGLGELAA